MKLSRQLPLVLAAVLAIATAATVLSGCGRSRATGISKDQWQSVRLGSTKSAVIAKLGQKPFREDTSPILGVMISYHGVDAGRQFASFTFDSKTGLLDSKFWSQSPGTASASIGPAEFRAAKRGMRMARLEAKLGVPNSREEIVHGIDIHGSFDYQAPGHIEREICLLYVWTPKPKFAASLCFVNGKLRDKTSPPA